MKRVWVCCCTWWYTGEGDFDLYTEQPGPYECHLWDCGYREVKTPTEVTDGQHATQA
jgi:hypothetical protein